MSDPPKPKPYNPRHPERMLLYQAVAEHYWRNQRWCRPRQQARVLVWAHLG
jgi:hypothetical protein